MKIFLSAVSSQFKACRDALRSDLSAVGAEVVVQEDFQQHGASLLEKLEQYITSCDRVIALIGDAYGAEPEEQGRPVGRARRSYTQWEYYFARGERLDGSSKAPKPLYVYFASPEFIAGLGAASDADPAGLQGTFVAEVRGSGKDWNEFKSLDELRALVLRDGFRLNEDNPKLRDSPQRGVVRGNHSILVQIQGNANRININLPHLSLVRYGQLAVRDSVGLLYAQARAIPLFGREETLNGLEAWANGEVPISIRVIVGSGGSGKTRLAMELCDRLAEAGWDAGFVTAAELTRFSAQQNLATWGWSRPTLVVIDYAAARAASINNWLGELASNPGTNNTPLRLLLFERHADPGSGWWAEAFGAGGAKAYAIQGLIDPPAPVKLLQLAPPQRRQLLDAMLEKLGSSERVPAEGADPQFDRQLANLPWGGEPLYLMIAASRAAQAGLGALLALNRIDLIKAVAAEERARLTRHAQASGLVGDVVCHMAAFATLCGGLDWEALADAVPAELQALRRSGTGDPADIADALHEALPGIEGSIAPMLPDAVGEGFVLEVLAKNRAASGVIKRAWQLAGLAVADTLIRCAQDFGLSEREPPYTWLRSLADDAEQIETLNALLQRIPQSTLTLRPLAAHLNRRIVETLAQDDRSPDAQVLRAGALNNLAFRLSEVGERDGALAQSCEAVAIYRELVVKNPDAFSPDLATSLNNLANFLSALGKREGALATAREAMEIRRELAAKNPDAFRPDLAMSLNNLANCLSELGDREGALAPAREALEIYRELVTKNPEAFRPNLAMSLNNLANRLSELGDRGCALASAREAVAISHELAAKKPDAFRPDLAGLLNNLANHLSELGDREGALAPALEAVAIYRELVAKNPDAFRPNLAMSLNNLANRLSELGDRGGALAPASEAVEIHRELVAKKPDAFRPDLASSLDNLANFLSALGNREGALAPAREAMEIRRELAAKNPDAFRPNLAMSLNNLAIGLSELGDREGALAPAREAVEIRRELAVKNPDAFSRDLAMSLNNLANFLSALGNREGALATAREAMEIRRELAAKNPDAFRPDLAMSLNNLANCMSELGDREGALAPASEAVDIYREFAAKNPDAFRPNLAASLNNLANLLGEEDDREGGLALAREAVAIYRELVAKNPDAFRPNLAMLLNTLANLLGELHDREGARALAQEAVETLVSAFLRHPQAFAQWMGMMVRNYLQRCRDCESDPDLALLAPIVDQFQKMQYEK